MTLAEAKQILTQPVRFGNIEQINALRFVESVDAAIEALKQCKCPGPPNCQWCEGSGVCTCGGCGHEHDCEDCDGEGIIECDCDCLNPFPLDVKIAAKNHRKA